MDTILLIIILVVSLILNGIFLRYTFSIKNILANQSKQTRQLITISEMLASIALKQGVTKEEIESNLDN